MARCVFCGDTHGRFLAIENLIKREEADIIIQTGDFGIWPNKHGGYEHIKVDSHVPVYFCRGNHEDHNVLDSFPDFQINNLRFSERLIKKEILLEPRAYSLDEKILEKNTKKQFPKAKNIYLCETGSILEFSGTKILFIGGASSTDRASRVEGKSWWVQETMWNYQIDHLLDMLDDEVLSDIDIVVSHTAPSRIVQQLVPYEITGLYRDKVCQLLDVIYNEVKPPLWFHGHFHKNSSIKDEHTHFIGLNMCDFNRNGKYDNSFYAMIDI